MKKTLILIITLTTSIIGLSYFNREVIKEAPSYYYPQSEQVTQHTQHSSWAEEQLHSMTLEEKIAQLAIIRIHSNYDTAYNSAMVSEIGLYQPGGVCFFQGGPKREIDLTNRIQAVSKIPMLVAIDGEWGPAMRLDSMRAFPRQMALGALSAADDRLIYEMGLEVGRQCRELGVHINFAPCIDINNNAQNPVINSRSFGENRELVVKKGKLYMQGMQDAGILTCLKHFPGHGDTETDSHQDLPIINKSFEELDELELYPFKELINAGADMVMLAHLNVPALDDDPNSISSLSYNVITDLLKKEYGFDGIVITDALDMNGLRKSYPGGGEAEIKALLSGVDILLLPNKLSIIIPAIKEAVETGVIPEELIDEKCLKVLKLKESLHLQKYTPADTSNIYKRLTTPKVENLIDSIERKALTLIKNDKNILPLNKEKSKETALLFIGGLDDSLYYRQFCKENGFGFFQTDREVKKATSSSIINQLSGYKNVISIVLNTNQSPKYNYGIYKSSVDFLKEVSSAKPTILVLCGNPYGLGQFNGTSNFKAIAVCYHPTKTTVRSAIRAIFGEGDFYGSLPVSTCGYKSLTGLHMLPVCDIQPSGYSSLPQSFTDKIDSLVQNGIKEKIFPGCQILAIQNGRTVYHKNFGKLTYEHHSPAVSDITLYDIASMTKPLATTLAVMKLYEEKKFKLSDPIGKYLTYLQNTDKQNITIEELLTHTSGLPAFIPFYKEMIKDHETREKYFRKEADETFCIEVAEGLYTYRDMPDELRQKIAGCQLSKKSYVYSDLSFVILKDLVETLTDNTLEKYLEDNFYRPMGLKRTSFHPLKQFEKTQIAPTEDDKSFRKQLIHGHVHDQTAALFSGVGGNAGLFSTATDISAILQMLMNKGFYNGKRFLEKSTVEEFTRTHVINGCSRRALGFDTPDFASQSSIIPLQSSKYTYGHQGFTGTVFWCDPDTQLIYIFLSNRVYPDSEPNKLAKSGIRLHVHKAICEGLKK